MDRVRSLEEQVAFFDSVYDLFLRIKSFSGTNNYYYRICETSVCLSFAGDALVRHITPALNHLRISEVENPDLTICLWDSMSTNSRMLPPPWKRDQYTYRGDIWGYNSSRIKTAFHWFEFSLNMMDLETNRGLFWVEHAENLPSWLRAAPLRTLLHWWLEKNECQFVHASSVGTGDGAVLLTGKGGIGKSTAALSCLKAGFFYLGDDYIVAQRRFGPCVYNVYNTAKLNADHVESFPEFLPLISNVKNMKVEKAVLLLYPEFGDRITRSMPLKAILVPRITDDSESRVRRISSENVLQAASFTTMTQLPGAGIKTYEFLNQLAGSLPCYSLELGRDPSRIPVAISDLLHALSNEDATGAPGKFSAEPPFVPRAWPVVSVILPVFNGERFIKEAVENIMSQDYPSLEIIIVDDGSTDKTKDIVERLPLDLRYLRQGNGGPAAARNRGIREATGEFIAFNDVDDLWPENNLLTMVKELLEHGDIEVLHGYTQLANYNDVTGAYDSIGAALYRRSAFNKVGLFDETLIYGEDSDWFARAQELKINIKKLDNITLIVRRHQENMTYGKTAVELNQLRVFKKRLDRLRSQGRLDHSRTEVGGDS
jgi:hypothetical protein